MGEQNALKNYQHRDHQNTLEVYIEPGRDTNAERINLKKDVLVMLSWNKIWDGPWKSWKFSLAGMRVSTSLVIGKA